MVETGRLAPCLEPSLLTFRAKSHGVASASRERGSCARVEGALVQEEAGSYVWSSTSLCRLAYDGQRDGSRKRAHGRGGDHALPGTSRTLARTWGFCQERQRLELVLIRPQGRENPPPSGLHGVCGVSGCLLLSLLPRVSARPSQLLPGGGAPHHNAGRPWLRRGVCYSLRCA